MSDPENGKFCEECGAVTEDDCECVDPMDDGHWPDEDQEVEPELELPNNVLGDGTFET